MKTFRTTAVYEIYKEVGGMCHPDYPFLDKRYSPSTMMPVCDLTPYITDFLANDNIDALKELWGFLTINSDIAIKLFDIALRAKVPSGLLISDYAKNELKATYLLMTRMSIIHRSAESPAARVASTTLSTRDFVVLPDLLDYIIDIVKLELKEAVKINPSFDAESALDNIATALRSDLGKGLSFANKMKIIPPMARVALSEFVNSMYFEKPRDDLWSRRVHFSLGYGDRAYGCSEEINRYFANTLDILKVVEGLEEVPSSITKLALYNALNELGVQVKKSLKRDDLISEAKKIPGVIQKLIELHEPDLMTLIPRVKDSACAWAERNKSLYYVGMAVLTFMGNTTLMKSSPQ